MLRHPMAPSRSSHLTPRTHLHQLDVCGLDGVQGRDGAVEDGDGFGEGSFAPGGSGGRLHEELETDMHVGWRC